MMLHEFLMKNQEEVLMLTEIKSLKLAGARPSSDQLKQGLPVFYKQLMNVLRHEKISRLDAAFDIVGTARSANDSDELFLTSVAGDPDEVEVTKTARLHGQELLRLGYTLSHVVHAYGAMCQSITGLAAEKNLAISTGEFHDLNRCLDVAIAGAVTGYQSLRNGQEMRREVEQLGFLVHELRNALTSVNISLQLIKRGTVGFGGSTGHLLDLGLKRIENLIDRSLIEVKLRVDPKVQIESGNLLHLVEQIFVTAEVEARTKKQRLEVQIDPTLMFKADRQLLYSALSNVIQNALKYTHVEGKVQVRGHLVGEHIVVEVEDECGGLTNTGADLFRPFEQQNKNRQGLGLGLSIAKRAMTLNHGTIEVQNLPERGCIFKITLPKNMGKL